MQREPAVAFWHVIDVFQSSPGAMSGCNIGGYEREQTEYRVSILTRRDVRVQPDAHLYIQGIGQVFQSSPGAMSGCNSMPSSGRPGEGMFQSSPGAMSGCNYGSGITSNMSNTFQSSPGAMSGCNP